MNRLETLEKMLYGGACVTALLMTIFMLVPAERWQHPLNDAVYQGFDPDLIYVDEKGDASSEGKVQVSSESLILTALSNSQPTVHLVTTPLKTFSAGMDIRILESGSNSIPLRIGVWSARDASGYFLDFDGSAGNLIIARTIVSGTVQQTLVGGRVVKSELLGSYSLGQVYHVETLLDKDLGTIQFRVTPQQARSSGVTEAAAVSKATLLTKQEVPGLFASLRLSLTLIASSKGGIATSEVSNYNLTLPHQRWQVAKIDDPRASALTLILLVTGVLLVVIRVGLALKRQHLGSGGRLLDVGIRSLSISRRTMVTGFWIIAVLVFFLVLNALLFGMGNLPFDMLSQKVWVYVSAAKSPLDLYFLPNVTSLAKVWGGAPYHEAVFPYNFGFAYYFAAIGWIYRTFLNGPGPLIMDTFRLEFLIKSVSVFFSLADGVLIYLILKEIGVGKWERFIAGSIFIFNPAVMFNTSIWGQTHVVSLFSLLLSLYLVEKRKPQWAWIALAITCLNRPQLLIPAFLLGLVLLRKFHVRETLYGISWSVILVFLFLGPFSLKIAPSTPVDVLVNQLVVQEAGGNEPALTTVSLDAYSLWPLVTSFTENASGLARFQQSSAASLIGNLSYQRLSQILTIGVLAIIGLLLLFHRQSDDEAGGYFPLLALGTQAFLMLTTGLGATHFVIALPLLILCRKWLKGSSYYVLVAIWSLTTLVPMYGSVGYALSNVGNLAPALEPGHNAITRFFMDLDYSDWFITLGTLANTLLLLWLAGKALGPLFMWDQVPGVGKLLSVLSQRRYVFLSILIAGLAGIWIYRNLASPNLLPGIDSGQWLTFSRFYLGTGMPDYRAPLSVPPLFPALLAVFASILGPLTAIPVLATLLFVGFCLSAFMLARELFGDELAALITLALVAVGQSLFLYLIAFGGYPQLMAMLWMNVAMFFSFRIIGGKDQARNWLGVAVATLLVLFSHTPTVIIFLPTLGMVLLYLALRSRSQLKSILLKAELYLAPPVLLWIVYLLLLWDQNSEYATNQAAFYHRGIGQVLSLYTDTSTQWMALLGLVCLAILLFSAWQRRGNVSLQAALLTAVMFFIPLGVMLGTFALRTGTDYVRFGFYFIEPLLFAIAFVFRSLLALNTRLTPAPLPQSLVQLRTSLSEIEPNRSNSSVSSRLLILGSSEDALARRIFSRTVLLRLMLVGGVAFLLLNGWQTLTFYPTALRYFSIENRPALLGVASWLDAHSNPDSTIFAPYTESRWIEGLTGRATLFDSEPYYLYRPGEIDRSMAANLIASGTYAMDNGYVLVRTQQVPGSVPINPSIAAFSKGMYVDIFTLQDRLINLDVTADGVARQLNLDRDFQRRETQWIKDETTARLVSLYNTNQGGANIAVSKTVSLSEDSPDIAIDFDFAASGNTGIRGLDFRIADPVETSGERAIAKAKVAWVDSQPGQTAIYRKDFDGSFIVTGIDFIPFPSRWMATQGNIRTGEPYLAAVYSFEGRSQVSLHIAVKPPAASRSRSGLATGSVFDLMKNYNVTHILARQTDKPLQAICKWYGYRQVYSNADYVVYQVPGN